jgi:hypothetical protein
MLRSLISFGLHFFCVFIDSNYLINAIRNNRIKKTTKTAIQRNKRTLIMMD